MSSNFPKFVVRRVGAGQPKAAGPSRPAAARAPTTAPATSAAAPPGRQASPPEPAAARPSGRIAHDDRGNAVWEWSVATGKFGTDVSSRRLRALDNTALALAEDAPTPVELARPNPQGTVKGYDPYDSGKLGRKPEPPKKKDLRKLSEWLKLKKQVANNRRDDD